MPAIKPISNSPDHYWSVFRYTPRALELVWQTHRGLACALAVLTLVSGVIPAGIAYVGARIVDAVVAALRSTYAGQPPSFQLVLLFVGLEAGLIIAQTAASRATTLAQSLLGLLLGQKVNVMILEKAITLDLAHFEESEIYDKLTAARRDASVRPLSLFNRTQDIVRNAITLASYAVLLIRFSPWAMALLVLAGLPPFVAESKFSNQSFKYYRRRAPESRKLLFIESVLALETYAKETKLFALGPLLLERYKETARKLYDEQRGLIISRNLWNLGLGLLATAAFYGSYAWIAVTAVLGRITLGQMTMYLTLFRNGQAAVASVLAAVSSMYEDNLYLSTLYEYLETPAAPRLGGLASGPDPADGIRFDRVSFTYPGSQTPTLADITLHVRPGQSLALVGENGAGKTTLIKLLTRLYAPSSGQILLDGLDLAEWDETALRRRIGVIFQDFARYQFAAGENVGAGDVRHFEDEDRWRQAAEEGLAASFLEDLPQGFHTQLGNWFPGGRELSGGQWQKVALSRAFMRRDANILVLDEPTAAMDAAAEAEIFAHFRALMQNRIAILISHRFSTVRMADQIVVIREGRITELGSHEELIRQNSLYARLFRLQAQGYQ